MASRTKKRTCIQCGKAHHNPDDLTAHMISEHGEPELPCSQAGCNKTFKAPRTLKRHVKEQHEEQSFSCRYCTFSCPRQGNVRRHEISCRKKDSQDGRLDNAVARSANPGSLEGADASRSSSFSPVPAFDFSRLVTPPTPLTTEPTESLWRNLRNLAIANAVDINFGGLSCEPVAVTERRQMKELICVAYQHGQIGWDIAQRWFGHLDQMAMFDDMSLSDCPPQQFCRSTHEEAPYFSDQMWFTLPTQTTYTTIGSSLYS